MKSIIKIGVLMLCLTVFVTSCKEQKQGEDAHTHDSPAVEKADMAMNDVYQCPMDCEKGKTYDETGSCPECGMELKKVEAKEDNKAGAEADSDHGHTHEDGDHEGHNH